jgi:hypothetical protein
LVDSLKITLIVLFSNFGYFDADFGSYLKCILMANCLNLSRFQHCALLNFLDHHYNYFHIDLGLNSNSIWIQSKDKVLLLIMLTLGKRISIKSYHCQSHNYSKQFILILKKHGLLL